MADKIETIGVKYSGADVQDLKQSLEQIYTANKQIKQSTDAVTTSLKEQGKEYDKLADQATTKSDEVAKGAKKEITALEKIEQLLKEEIEDLEQIKVMSKEAFSPEEIKKYQKSIADTEDRIKLLQKQLKNINGIGLEVKNSTRLVGQLRDLKNELILLEQQGKRDTEEFEKLSIAAIKLENEINNTNARIRALASDTKNIDTLIQGIEGVTAAFSIAQGATALFGNENENLQEALLKVQAATAILSGVQSLQNTIQKQTAITNAVITGQKKLEVIVTNLQTASESKNIIVRYAAIAAQKALNAVMAANPGTILLTVFAALAGALVYFSEGENKAEKQAEALNESLRSQAEALQAVSDFIEFDTERQIANAKLAGKADSDLAAIRIDGLKRQITQQEEFVESARSAAQSIQDNEDATEEAYKESVKVLADAEQKAIELNRKRELAEVDYSITVKKETEDRKKKLEEEQKKYQEILEKRRAITSESREREIKQTEKGERQALDLLNLRREKERQDLEKRLNDAQVFGKQRQNALLLFDKETYDLQIQQYLDFTAEQEKIRKDATAKEKADREHQLQIRLEIEDRLYTEQNTALTKQYTDELKTIDNNEQAKTRLDFKYTTDRQALELEQLKSRKQILIENGQSTVEVEKEIAEKQLEIQTTLTDKIIEQTEKRKQLQLEIASSVGSAILDITDNSRKARFDQELSALDKEKEAALSNKELTEEQKTQIEQRFAEQAANIKRDQFQKDKQAAIIRATIDGALAVIKALPNPALAIAAGVAAAAQIAVIAAQPVPEFAEGVIDLQGPGTGTSDSIPARLSRGESVMTAKETQRYRDELQAMRNRNYEQYITQTYVVPRLREYHEAQQGSMAEKIAAAIKIQNDFDDTGIVHGLSKIKPATAKDIQQLGRSFRKTMQENNYRNNSRWRK